MRLRAECGFHPRIIEELCRRNEFLGKDLAFRGRRSDAETGAADVERPDPGRADQRFLALLAPNYRRYGCLLWQRSA